MSYEYEPLLFTWRVIHGPGALGRKGPFASDEYVGPLVFGEVVHPAGKPVWMTFDEFNNQAATNLGQTHWILRLPIWMGSDKDKMWIAWVTIRCNDGGYPEILQEHENKSNKMRTRSNCW